MPKASARQLEQLAQQLEPAFVKAFQDAIKQAKGRVSPEYIAVLLDRGLVDEAVEALGINDAGFAGLTEALRDAYKTGGQQGASEMPRIRLTLDPAITGGWLDPVITGGYSSRPAAKSPALNASFNLRNTTAERWLQANSTRLVTGIINDQREMIRQTLVQAKAAGRGPRQTALDIVGRVGETGRRTGGQIGITAHQAQFVQNLRAELASGDPRQMANYFTRARRDKRLDGIVKRAIAGGKSVSQADIDKIAGRYSDRLLALRGETIARTESITSLNAGRDEAYRQQIESGQLAPENVTGTWQTGGDNRVRHTHAAMQGQKRTFGQPFQSPSGALMNYPGDSSLGAPAEETVACRCTKKYQINMAAEALRGQQIR
jgi:hypothetical protein